LVIQLKLEWGILHRVNPVEYLISSKAIHIQGRICTIFYTDEAIEITPQGQPCGIFPALNIYSFLLHPGYIEKKTFGLFDGVNPVDLG